MTGRRWASESPGSAPSASTWIAAIDMGRGSGLDAVRAAAEDSVHSVTLVTRKPPGGLERAPNLRERNVTLAGLTEPASCAHWCRN